MYSEFEDGQGSAGSPIDFSSPGDRLDYPPRQAEEPAEGRPGSHTFATTLTFGTWATGSRIGLEDFTLLATIGKGTSSKIMLAEKKTSKELSAIKVIKKELIIKLHELSSVRVEKNVLLKATQDKQPFVVHLQASFQTETRLYFVMEYVSGGDLMFHLQRGPFGTRRAQFYAAEVCLALKWFHERQILYRDLKLGHILLGSDGHIKIVDFGICKESMLHDTRTSTFCGTTDCMAPEILLDKKYGLPVDWWEFGVIVYQMLLQQTPFSGEDEDEMYDAILTSEPSYPIDMPRDSVSILQKLLVREPEQRLGSGLEDALEVMRYAFFEGINWDDLYNKRSPAPFLPSMNSPEDTSNFDSEFTVMNPVLTPVQSGDRVPIISHKSADKSKEEIMAGCVVCHAKTPIKRCARCHIPQYCSTTCQKSDWKSHKSSCEPEKDTNVEVRVRPGGPDVTRSAANSQETASLLLSNIPQEETYRRLIDTYRLRAADALLMGGEERGWTYDLRNGGPPKDDFHNFLVKARKQDVLPTWFGLEAQHACIEYAMNSEGNSFIGHAIDAEDVEEDYKDKSMPTKMRAVAAYIYGREYRFDDPRFANIDAATLGASLARQKMQLGRQGVQCLPRKPGRERKETFDLHDPNNAAQADMLDHYMTDFTSVADRMSLDQYMELLKKHRFNSIKDIEY